MPRRWLLCNSLTNLSTQDHFNLQQDGDIRIAVLLAYQGAAFHGSQFQPGLPTVQSALRDAFEDLRIPMRSLMFAGRTDRGVHARGQVAHCIVPQDAFKNIDNPQRALNAKLPASLSVEAIALNVDPAFHAQHHARAKWYRYSLSLAAHRSASLPPDVAWMGVPMVLDFEKLNRAAALLVGQHDFTSFQSTGGNASVDTICNISHAKFQNNGRIAHFDIVGDRFLYKMVRNLVSSLLEIGATPELPPERILQVIAQQHRQQAPEPAKATGLSLMAVAYDPPANYFSDFPYVQSLTQFLSEHSNENLLCKAS